MLPDVHFHTKCAICGEPGQPFGSAYDPTVLEYIPANDTMVHRLCKLVARVNELENRLSQAERVTHRHMILGPGGL